MNKTERRRALAEQLPISHWVQLLGLTPSATEAILALRFGRYQPDGKPQTMTNDPKKEFGATGPTLEFTDDAETTVLARRSVELVAGDLKLPGKAEIKLDLVPVPGLYIYGVFDDPCSNREYVDITFNRTSVSHFIVDGQRLDGILAGRSYSPKGVLKVKWCLIPEPVQVLGNDTTAMSRLVANVFNLETRLWLPSAETIGKLELEHGPWKGHIRTTESSTEHLQDLRLKGGYRLTHVVEATQKGGYFDGHTAHTFLQAMQDFLTFARGGMCNLVCPSGLDDAGKLVWARWSSPSHWPRTGVSWFDRKEAEPLAKLFPGFMDKWTIDRWQDALRTAIWWYAHANSGSLAVDQGIVSAQIAMERLSYEFCVYERGLVSKDGFERLPAADQYRLLLASLDIPIEIPDSATSLASASREYNWTDGPHALTHIRNGLVHGGRNQARLEDECYMEAWLLSTWLLELTILAICGFQDEHWNRLTGAKEQVPWATEPLKRK